MTSKARKLAERTKRVKMNKATIATILGVASLSLVKKIGSSSKLISFLGNPEPIEATITGYFYPCRDNVGETYDAVADMDLDLELEDESGDLMDLSYALQSDTDIDPSNTDEAHFLQFLNTSYNIISQYMTQNIGYVGLGDASDLIKRYVSVLYNLKSIKLDFPEDMIDSDNENRIICNIHCTFKFTNTGSQISNMMEDIVEILGQNNQFEDYLSSSTKVDPQNKLTEKMKKYVFGTTISELRKF